MVWVSGKAVVRIVALLAAALVIALALFHAGNDYALAQKQWSAERVLKDLFIGRLYDEYNLDDLLAHNITHVLTVNVGQLISHPHHMSYMQLRASDTPDQNIINYFNQTNAYIDEALNGGGRILINCMHAQSRSPSVTIAYVMMRFNMPYHEARMSVQKRHGRTHPKTEFARQLMVYGALLTGHLQWGGDQYYKFLEKWPRRAQVVRSEPENGREHPRKWELPQPAGDGLSFRERANLYARHTFYLLGNYCFYYLLRYLNLLE